MPLTSTSPGLAPDEPPARARFRILLEPVSAEPGAVTGSFAGFDTGAPRRLDLWRVDAGRAERLGRVTSDADARIHGPQLALPEAGIELVVTPKGVRPGEPDASQPLRLARASQADGQAPAPGAPRWWHASIQGSEGGLQ